MYWHDILLVETCSHAERAQRIGPYTTDDVSTNSPTLQMSTPEYVKAVPLT